MDEIAATQKQNNAPQKLLYVRTIVKVIKEHKKTYLITMPIVLVVAFLFIMCVPRYYRSSVTLAPESSDVSSGGLSSTLSSLGIGSLNKMMNKDAISLELYPDLLGSKDFIIKMFAVGVTTKDCKTSTTYYDYLANHTKAPWWDQMLNYIKEIFKKEASDNYRGKANEKIDVFTMTKKQQDIASMIKNNISCKIDQKTDAFTITVTDQDPKVCAMIANKTAEQLMEFIIEYRTKKAKNDYQYYTELCDKALKDYETAREKYASYSDANYNPEIESIRSKVETLENDMQLKYNTYSSMVTMKQTAQAKIQEKTPAFTTLESASIPTLPAGPKRTIGALAFMMLYAIGLTVYYLRKYIC